MMLNPSKELVVDKTIIPKTRCSDRYWKMLPISIQDKNAVIAMKLEQGIHPLSLGAKKIRCLPDLYRMRISHSYRMLIGLEDNHWTSLGLYSRQSFTTLLNRRRR